MKNRETVGKRNPRKKRKIEKTRENDLNYNSYKEFFVS